MRFHRYSDAEMEEFRRPRTVSDEEFEEHLVKITQNREQEEQRLLRLRSGESRTYLLDAASDAEFKLLKSVLGRWQEDETIRPWDASEQVFKRTLEHCLIDNWRARHRESPLDIDGLEWFSGELSRTGQSLTAPQAEYYDDTGVREIDQLMVERLNRVRESQRLLSAVATRTLRVISQRTVKPQLDELRATVALFYAAAEWGDSIGAGTEGDPLAYVDEEGWRDDLAEALKVSKEVVYEATAGILREVKKGFYLFIVLAPRTKIVVDTDVMDRLLSLTHLDGNGLSATARMLLQKAGSRLERVEWEWTIDKKRFLRDARKLGRMKGEGDEGIIARLHDSEMLYSVRVPEQTIPPQFRCVTRCAEHSPSKED
ncbi:MAG TPA: hypothetical protein PKE40_01120 [Arachnia sp.]|nr:hypothetical protein [Arachnia sp.]HMT84928.1 hypothetical protein [Arachnia sp.]